LLVLVLQLQLGVYNQISKQYKLENKNILPYDSATATQYQGHYASEKSTNDLIVKFEKDSLFIGQGTGNWTYLVPLEKDRFFLENIGQMSYFISFIKNEKDTSDFDMKVHLMADRLLFKKIKK